MVMPRFPIVGSFVVALVVLALVAGVPGRTSPTAFAQDASPAASNQHPIVGSWYWENISDDPFDDSYAVFGGDGTYVEETTYIGGGIGSWQATGDRSLDLIIV